MFMVEPSIQIMSCRYSRVACDTAWHATQRGMRHSVSCDTAWACPQVPVAAGTAADPLPAQDVVIIDSDGDDML